MKNTVFDDEEEEREEDNLEKIVVKLPDGPYFLGRDGTTK